MLSRVNFKSFPIKTHLVDLADLAVLADYYPTMVFRNEAKVLSSFFSLPSEPIFFVVCRWI